MAQRFLGGIFGNTVSSTAKYPAISGVYDSRGQYYMKQEGGWVDQNVEATGGTTTTPGNGYKYHFFTSPGTFVVSDAGGGTVEVFVVGGGGSGGDQGGGGGGGVATGPVPISAQTYPISIGAGGPAAGNNNAPGNGGYDTTISTPTGGWITGNGGGKGCSGDGGSGGGGSQTVPHGGSITGGPGNQPTANGSVPTITNYGNAGGNVQPTNSAYTGAGGGGAGAAGSSSFAANNQGSAGGDGIAAFSGDTGIPPSYGTPGPTAAVGLLVVVEEDLIMPLVVLLEQVVHLQVVVVKIENLLLLLTQAVDLVEHMLEVMLGVLVLL